MPRSRPVLPACLQTSVGLRMPVFAAGTSPSSKIGQLEDYLLLTAYTQGELTEVRMDWMCSLVPIRDEWDHMPNEEWAHLRRTRTETAVTHAKRMARPDLYDQMLDHDWMIKRLSEEFDRMEREAARASRVYTMITGS